MLTKPLQLIKVKLLGESAPVTNITKFKHGVEYCNNTRVFKYRAELRMGIEFKYSDAQLENGTLSYIPARILRTFAGELYGDVISDLRMAQHLINDALYGDREALTQLALTLDELERKMGARPDSFE